ncbi:MAG: hypothetical protein ACOYT4_02630 [Nanoarchaeota archaeon]
MAIKEFFRKFLYKEVNGRIINTEKWIHSGYADTKFKKIEWSEEFTRNIVINCVIQRDTYLVTYSLINDKGEQLEATEELGQRMRKLEKDVYLDKKFPKEPSFKEGDEVCFCIKRFGKYLSNLDLENSRKYESTNKNFALDLFLIN